MTVDLFDPNFYRYANPDLASFSDAQAREHFQVSGLAEGREFSPLVDLNFYRATSSDLAGFDNSQAYTHLQSNGIAEGRRFSPLVDLNFYRAYNTDLATLNNEQLFEHLRNSGINEGRRFSTFTDLNFYRAANPDLSPVLVENRKLFEHLAKQGINEGRRFNISFDSNYYRNAYPDLASSGLDNEQLLNHFELNGLQEGRASSDVFDVNYYLNNNPDLRSAGFNNQQAQQHFELYGFLEGRLSSALNRFIRPPTDGTIGSSMSTAYSLGILSGNLTVNQAVSTTNLNDYYRFTLGSTSNVSLSLGDLSGRTKLELLFDRNGNGQIDYDDGLYSDYGYSNEDASISSPLGAGTYFARVFYDTSDTNYNLKLTTTPSPSTTPTDPGDTVETALDIGSLNGNRTFNEFVGSTDLSDYYRFSVDSTRNFNLSLSGLGGDVDVRLLNDRREILQNSANSGNTAESISRNLEAGTYFVRIYPYTRFVNTNYTLSLAA